jgi:hypothetical protein
MANVVEVNKITDVREDKKGNTVFRAAGTLNGRKFVALTIQWQGEPIFKVQEEGSHKGLDGSGFTRGDRIAIARTCKAERLKLFGNEEKDQVEPELETGELVELSADETDEADEASAAA